MSAAATNTRVPHTVVRAKRAHESREATGIVDSHRFAPVRGSFGMAFAKSACVFEARPGSVVVGIGEGGAEKSA
jgi:hypothetical protein